MADLNDLLKSKKVSTFVRQSKSRPWTINQEPEASNVLPREIEVSKLLTSHPTAPTITGHKPDTNRAQTGHKPDTKPRTNRTQTGHNIFTEIEAIIKTGHKVDTQPDTRPDTKWTQTAHKPDTKNDFSSLVGHQREVAIFIYRSCQYARSQETDPLTLEHIATSLKIRIGSIKNTLRRLVEKGILERVNFRNGRGGWSKYRLPETVFREMLQLETGHKLNTNRAQTGHEVDTQPDTQPDTSRSSSSSSLVLDNFKTTTTSETEFLKMETVQLSPEWQSVDYSPLAEIGFTETHLVQVIRQGKLSVIEVQDSIQFFAFDLKRNGKGTAIHGSPLNFFMGILRRGQAYAPPDNFESPEAEARRKYLEGKRSIEAKRLAEEQELRTLEFNQWKRGLSPNDIAAIVPEYAQKRSGPIQDAALLGHFEKEIWPSLELQVPGLLTTERLDIRKEILKSFGEVSE